MFEAMWTREEGYRQVFVAEAESLTTTGSDEFVTRTS